MTEQTTVTLGFAIAIVLFIISVYNFMANRRAIANQEGNWQGKVELKLDNILSKIQEIATEQTQLKKEIHSIDHELSNLRSRVETLEKLRQTGFKYDGTE